MPVLNNLISVCSSRRAELISMIFYYSVVTISMTSAQCDGLFEFADIENAGRKL